MPTTTFNNKEVTEFELLPDGEYIVEVIEYADALSDGPKTRSCPQIELTLLVEKPGSNTKGRINFVSLTFPDDLRPSREDSDLRDYLDGVLDSFAVCMGLVDKNQIGQGIDWNESTVMGLRGWALIGKRTSKTNKTFNEVKKWLRDKPKLPKRERKAEVDPFAAPVAAVENDDPFA